MQTNTKLINPLYYQLNIQFEKFSNFGRNLLNKRQKFILQLKFDYVDQTFGLAICLIVERQKKVFDFILIDDMILSPDFLICKNQNCNGYSSVARSCRELMQ